MTVTARVQGADEMVADLKRASREAAQAAVLEVMQDHADRLVRDLPSDTGTLRRSVRVEPTRDGGAAVTSNEPYMPYVRRRAGESRPWWDMRDRIERDAQVDADRVAEKVARAMDEVP